MTSLVGVCICVLRALPVRIARALSGKSMPDAVSSPGELQVAFVEFVGACERFAYYSSEVKAFPVTK